MKWKRITLKGKKLLIAQAILDPFPALTLNSWRELSVLFGGEDYFFSVSSLTRIIAGTLKNEIRNL